jgi:hypothetical protein
MTGNTQTRDTRAKSTASSDTDATAGAPAWAVALQEDTVQKLKAHIKNKLDSATEKIDSDLRRRIKPILNEHKEVRKATTEMTHEVTM